MAPPAPARAETVRDGSCVTAPPRPGDHLRHVPLSGGAWRMEVRPRDGRSSRPPASDAACAETLTACDGGAGGGRTSGRWRARTACRGRARKGTSRVVHTRLGRAWGVSLCLHTARV
eukprot:4709313-Prymnesium_polylepis.2